MSNVLDFPDKNVVAQEAAEWLVRLDGDKELSKEERDALRCWLERSPVHSEELRGLVALWHRTNVLTELAVPLGQSRLPEPDSGVARNRAAWISAMAAALLLALGAQFWPATTTDMQAQSFHATQIGQQQSQTLPDGSVVLLNTNTQIKVHYSREYRDIYLLQGEAHFTVTEGKPAPFRVFAGVGRIHAVGTAFSVHVKNDAVDVTVTEGKVGLASIVRSRIRSGESRAAPGGAARVAAQTDTPVQELGILSAGQVATIRDYDDPSIQGRRIESLRELGQPDMSRRMAWTEGVLLFSGEPLEQVVREISRYTTVKIEFSEPEVGSIRIGGRFPVGETEAMFAALEENFGLRVTHLSDAHVVVSAVTR